MLLASGLLLASNSGSSTIVPPHAASAPTTTPELPQQEQKFCEITSVASMRYFSLARGMKKAHDEKNGILEKRGGDAMTSTAHERDSEVFKLGRESNFKFENWVIQLLKVGTPNDKRVTFTVRPLCSDIVKIHLTGSANAALID